MINFDTDKIIIVCFPSYAGGKFVTNCLNHSDRCVFQEASLVQQQLDGKFTKQDKLNYIYSELDNTKEKWVNLNMSTYQLFGIHGYEYLEHPPEELKYKPIIETLSNDNQHYFFLIAHSFEELDIMVNVWKNAKVIMYTNVNKFMEWRIQTDRFRIVYVDRWNKLKGTDWPNTPPSTIEELESLPESILLEMKSDFDNFYAYCKQYLEHPLMPDVYQKKVDKFKNSFHGDYIEWNTDWYFSESDTVKQVKNVFEKFGLLEDYNVEEITEFYRQWSKTLHELKRQNRY